MALAYPAYFLSSRNTADSGLLSGLRPLAGDLACLSDSGGYDDTIQTHEAPWQEF